MASSLSEDEFQRMQLQLLDLRTSNYQLEDQCKRKAREIEELQQHASNLDRELQKASKALSKSKKAKEVELLLQENDSLQRKLGSQEDEFRLQNETLMQELASLVTQNEQLEKANQELEGTGSQSTKEDDITLSLQDQVRRQQAENSALQKNLTLNQEKYEREVVGLRQTVADLETQCLKLAGQRGTPVGQGSGEERSVEGQDAPGVIAEDIPDSSNTDSNLQEKTIPRTAAPKLESDEMLKELYELRLNLDTEKEEKNLLREQLTSKEQTYREQIQTLTQELDRVSDKLKKKQESLLQLQEEKENMYTEMSGKLGEVEASKASEWRQLEEQHNQTVVERDQLTQALQMEKEAANSKVQELEKAIEALKSQVNTEEAEHSQRLQEQNSAFESQLGQLRDQLHNTEQERDDLRLQLQEAQKKYSEVSSQLVAMQHDRDTQTTALHEANKVAEKRKSLLDELAIKYQTECDQHRTQKKTMEDEHQSTVSGLQSQLDTLKGRCDDLAYADAQCEQLKQQLQSLEQTKGWLERHLAETEESMRAQGEEKDQALEEVVVEHNLQLDELRASHQGELDQLTEQIMALEQEKHTLEDSVSELQQKIKDSVDDKKIHEKKGLTIVKDLKRQLQGERKRVEKLQERLQELLQSDTRSRQSIEELLRPTDPSDRQRGDNSSLSSWSAGGWSQNMSQGSPEEECSQLVVLEQDNADLLKRFTDLQQNSWTLEEKVSHLESSNAAMAEDLLQKTAIIEHYVMESKTEVNQSPQQDNFSLKKMMDIIKDKGDDNMREMNRKLQRMLEETLTKNMHLQKDLEMLSQEVVRLSKMSGELAGNKTG